MLHKHVRTCMLDSRDGPVMDCWIVNDMCDRAACYNDNRDYHYKFVAQVFDTKADVCTPGCLLGGLVFEQATRPLCSIAYTGEQRGGGTL